MTDDYRTTFDWLRAHVDYAGDDCLTWPYGRDDKGYGQVTAFDKVRKAHRVICELAHGIPPSRKHCASHSCGNGHLGCVNPRHLSWQTYSENQIDRYRKHGRGLERYFGRNGKLTKDQRRAIIEARGKIPPRELAQQFDVKIGTIHWWHRRADKDPTILDH